ncbi:hypothetical protein BDY21DRAFT_346978 [Lineolata rhizophorae]|uniref:Uncharacterized protein n=1 Tax=Lineolata rhizophorae TaxID=578093 RepID=A0A6A6NXZ2_9PEZI|nr:hypothetical protein BDY21DRAFT_346978 [Lineolata rhizophorae]
MSSAFFFFLLCFAILHYPHSPSSIAGLQESFVSDELLCAHARALYVGPNRSDSAAAPPPTPPLTPKDEPPAAAANQTAAASTKDDEPAAGAAGDDARGADERSGAGAVEHRRGAGGAGALAGLWDALVGSLLAPVGRWFAMLCGGGGRRKTKKDGRRGGGGTAVSTL